MTNRETLPITTSAIAILPEDQKKALAAIQLELEERQGALLDVAKNVATSLQSAGHKTTKALAGGVQTKQTRRRDFSVSGRSCFKQDGWNLGTRGTLRYFLTISGNVSIVTYTNWFKSNLTENDPLEDAHVYSFIHDSLRHLELEAFPKGSPNGIKAITSAERRELVAFYQRYHALIAKLR